MENGSKSGGCKSASHQMFKDKAKNRVDDLQGMFTDLQSAREESRSIDVALLEEQVHQMLREWKDELNEPSPASSLQVGSLDSLDIYRLLHLDDEEDDATSALAALRPELDAQKVGDSSGFKEGFRMNQEPQGQDFRLVDQCKGSISALQSTGGNYLGFPPQLDYQTHDLQQDPEQNFSGFDCMGPYGGHDMHHVSAYLPNISPPPSAFLGPQCALWDCPRPVQGLDWCQDYCSIFHASLALNEGLPGTAPVLRPGGIGLKDGLLFAALRAMSVGKNVGIPECEGAATAKSPWNAHEIFDLTVLEGETIREWLFFDKPRRAFESGNRKQRSLPDHNGRGWHESRKQVMNEFGGLKRSYYMDPQPLKDFEWHLYEYEINGYNAIALYRLEFKLVTAKKGAKGKITNDAVADLQKQMGRLTAKFPLDNKPSLKGRTKVTSKDGVGNLLALPSDGLDSGIGESYDYLVENLEGYQPIT